MKVAIGVLIFVVLNIFYEIFWNRRTIDLNAEFFTSDFFIGMIIQALIAALSFYLADRFTDKSKS
jgi:hypothetical protein